MVRMTKTVVWQSSECTALKEWLAEMSVCQKKGTQAGLSKSCCYELPSVLTGHRYLEE